MADEDEAQKTEEPTPRKLAQAKEKGQVGTSQEVKSWGILFVGGMCIAMLAPWMMKGLANYMRIFVEQADSIVLEQEAMPMLFADAMLKIGMYTSPMLSVLVLAAILSNVAQTGLIVAPSKLKPELKKISLIAGVKRMFSARSVIEFLKGIFKLTVLSSVAFFMARPWFDDVALIPDMDVELGLDRLFIVCLALITGALIVLTIVAVLDFTYQKFEFTKSMRMSHQDIKDEFKDTEGDPKIKARIRQIRAQRAQQRMMDNVPKADVVITNPTHFAVALQYDMGGMQAPKLVAKGVDSLAFRIREVAEANDVPIIENPPLARALYAAVEMDQEIPVEQYQAVAEVIGYVMKLKGKKSGGSGPTVQ